MSLDLRPGDWVRVGHQYLDGCISVLGMNGPDPSSWCLVVNVRRQTPRGRKNSRARTNAAKWIHDPGRDRGQGLVIEVACPGVRTCRFGHPMTAEHTHFIRENHIKAIHPRFQNILDVQDYLNS